MLPDNGRHDLFNHFHFVPDADTEPQISPLAPAGTCPKTIGTLRIIEFMHSDHPGTIRSSPMRR